MIGQNATAFGLTHASVTGSETGKMKIQLNLVRVQFSAPHVSVYVRPFGHDDRMAVIRSNLPGGWLAYGSKNEVYAWRHSGSATPPGAPWQGATVHLEDNAELFLRLLESGVSRFLESKGYEVLSRMAPTLVDTSTNLLDGCLSAPCDSRVGIHPVISIEGFLKGRDGGVDIFLIVGTRTQWRLSIPVAELASNGVDCTRLGVRLM